VMVTHDMAEAVLLADRVVVLKAGRILADGFGRQAQRPGSEKDCRRIEPRTTKFVAQLLRVRSHTVKLGNDQQG